MDDGYKDGALENNGDHRERHRETKRFDTARLPQIHQPMPRKTQLLAPRSFRLFLHREGNDLGQETLAVVDAPIPVKGTQLELPGQPGTQQQTSEQDKPDPHKEISRAIPAKLGDRITG